MRSSINNGPERNWPGPLKTIKAVLLAVVLAISLVACRGDSGVEDRATLLVVTSTVVLADFAREIGGEAVEAESLVPSGGDIHVFRTKPSDAVRLGDADVVLLNGAGLDDFLVDVIESATRSETIVLEVSEGLNHIQTAKRGIDDHDEDHAHEHEHGGVDPHYWLDPIAAIDYVKAICDALIKADPDRAREYRDNTDYYVGLLLALDEEIRMALEAVPQQRRVLVTSHDSFGYFGARYDFMVVPVVGGEGGAPTPGDIAAVIKEIDTKALPAIFVEAQLAQDALRAIALETTVDIGTLRSAAFDEEAPNYIEMMRENTRIIAEHLT